LRVVIDANVLLSAVTDRDLGQRSRAESLIRLAAESRVELLIPQCCLFEVIYVLETRYRMTRDEVRQLVGDLLSMPRLRLVHELDAPLWLQMWTESIPEPADAAVAVVAMSTRSAVATFDRKLINRLRKLSVDVWLWPKTRFTESH
jgi:predicted nucleic acid-binding protein